jgi:hypothetical protein
VRLHACKQLHAACCACAGCVQGVSALCAAECVSGRQSGCGCTPGGRTPATGWSGRAGRMAVSEPTSLLLFQAGWVPCMTFLPASLKAGGFQPTLWTGCFMRLATGCLLLRAATYSARIVVSHTHLPPHNMACAPFGSSYHCYIFPTKKRLTCHHCAMQVGVSW